MYVIYCSEQLDGISAAAIVLRYARLRNSACRVGGFLNYTNIEEKFQEMAALKGNLIFVLDFPPDQIENFVQKLKEISTRNVANLKIKYFPKYSATIEECFSVIRKYVEKHSWRPDIIIFDYIDILKQSSGNNEMTWQDIDHMWKQASGFAQEMDALVITADQTTKAGRTSRMLDHTVTPQASTKDHHVNLKLGLSKIEDETMNNICRLNVIYHRHKPFNRANEVLITQNLTICHAIIDSVFWYDKMMPPYPIKLPEKVL